MEKKLKELNKQRLVCIAWLPPVVLFAGLTLMFLFFAVSPDVHLDFALPFILSLVCLAAFLFVFFRYRNKYSEYEKNYRENVRKISFFNEFDGCNINAGHPDSSILEMLGVISVGENADFAETFSALYEDIPFITSFFKAGNFYGQLFVYTFDVKFKKDAKVRQRGFTVPESPSESNDNIFEKYKTDNSMFDYTFIAMAATPSEGKLVLTEEVIQSFLKLRLNTTARIFAFFSQEKLYVVLQNPKKHFNIPLFFGIKPQKIKEEMLFETKLVNNLASELKLEKRIWRKYASD